MTESGTDEHVSVGICAYNEGGNIGRLLRRLLEEDVNEIIVVASGCTDGTADIVGELASTDSRIRLVADPERRGKAVAFNKILRTYTGDYLVSLPADVVPRPGAVRRLVLAMRPEIGVVGGLPQPVNPPGGIMDDVCRFIWGLHNRSLQTFSERGDLRHISGEMFAMRRGVVESLPANAVNEDAYIALRARQSGFEVIVCPDAVVDMVGPRTARDYLAQRRRVLWGHLQLRRLAGRFPSVPEFEAARKPRLVWRAIRGAARQSDQPYLVLLVAVLLEGIAGLWALGDTLFGKSHVLWERVSTTKRMEWD